MAEHFTLRSYGRTKTRCILYYLGAQVSGTGSVRDVSVGGWRVIGDHPVTVGTTLSLRIFLPTSPDPVQVESATVQWVNGREFGLSVTAMPEASLSAIKAFLNSALEKPSECARTEEPSEEP